MRNAVNLSAFGQAADDKSRGRQLLASQIVVLLHDLHGEFARGNQRERCDSGSLILEQPLDYRDQERQRLAGACLRGREHVLACKRRRNRGCLHRSRYRKASGR